jgi:FtsH-binding integral membrane protein
MKFSLLIYVLLGTGMSAMITDTSSVKLGFKEVLILIGFHIPFIGLGAWIAVSSKPTRDGYRHGLSPGAWGVALVASYVVGFIGFMFAK